MHEDERLIGCGALRELDCRHAEIKSMRSSPAARGKGIGRYILDHLMSEARRRGYRKVSLETGSMPFFEPARALYRSFGFRECPPFANYVADPNSVFFEYDLEEMAAG